MARPPGRLTEGEGDTLGMARPPGRLTEGEGDTLVMARPPGQLTEGGKGHVGHGQTSKSVNRRGKETRWAWPDLQIS